MRLHYFQWESCTKKKKVIESLKKKKKLNFLKCFINALSPLLLICMHLHASYFHVRTEVQKYWKKKLLLQYLWSDSEKKIPEISCKDIVLMRFPTNCTEQHNLNTLNLFPVSKPSEVFISPQMLCYIVQKLCLNKRVCYILQKLWVSKEVIKPGNLYKLSNISINLFI